MIFKKANKRNLISNIILVALFIVFCLSVQNNGSLLWNQIISKVLIFSIAALALNIVCGCLGEFALGHGGFLLIGYTAAVIVAGYMRDAIGTSTFREIIYSNKEGLQALGYLVISSDVLIAALITGIFGLIVGLISLARLKGDYLAIVTLGFSLIFVNLGKNIEVIGGAQGTAIVSKLRGTTLIYGILLVLAIFLILAFMKSRFGRSILACRDDNIAAEACGVAVNKYKVLAFTFASFIAGIAGGLLANYTTYAPTTFGQDRSILFLVIIVLGGLGSLTGSIIASSLIVIYELWFCQQTWVPEFFTSNPKIIYGIILVLIMLFRSSGILGTAEFTWDWFYKKIKKVWGTIFNKKTPKEVE
jgi:branched-chain amino acid transport system permease protein